MHAHHKLAAVVIATVGLALPLVAQAPDGWYVVSGRVDKASYGLLVFFVASVALLWVLNSMI